MASNNIGPSIGLKAKIEGVGITWVRFFDEGIRPTVVDKIEQGMEVISGPIGGKWKRAARQGLVEEPNLKGEIHFSPSSLTYYTNWSLRF